MGFRNGDFGVMLTNVLEALEWGDNDDSDDVALLDWIVGREKVQHSDDMLRQDLPLDAQENIYWTGSMDKWQQQ
ncbi:hypothetical protein PAAG_12369 [Paracoccidioides lutzii Pb01]|uniref:Uncharacterized protein n=1 Tax=Paracoccidioides lutzii (strain ATCC MYA-826 / Pb01) TaxID=502779 RepID=A0A0A2V3I1_PARBA|nr:hypothetical protein PAAG_12369 [Paracoccidioides lutzii Pb01]KGQ00942.1 hypothetical protein PAAG_12369 [Paracoccidioides lutzii Pb01]